MFWKHSGSFSLGMRSEVAFLPSENLAIAVLSNAGPTGVPEGLVESFFDMALEGKPERDWMEFANRMFAEEIKKELGKERDYSHLPAQATPPLALAVYAGKYANDFFGSAEVVDRRGSLILRIGPKALEFSLRHFDRDVFIYQPTGESAGGPAGLRFAVEPGGRADRVLIENLNNDGLGSFLRVK